ncbi:MAG: type 4a pilus biogenesis protein PilO [Phycisphaerae bacterium]|nr:type 4a pilus biogenesis protein PilO [Phycisphaerae bacterium]
MNFSKREMIFVGLTLGILFAAWMLILRPRETSMERMQSQIQEKRRLLEEIGTSRPRAIGNLKSDIETLQTIVEEQRIRLPEGENIEKIFRDLSNLAISNQLRIHQIKTNPTTPNLYEPQRPGIEEQGFNLQLEGEFQGVRAFLEQLEKHSRIFRVDELRIMRNPKETEQSTVQCTLRLRVFSRKETKVS